MTGRGEQSPQIHTARQAYSGRRRGALRYRNRMMGRCAEQILRVHIALVPHTFEAPDERIRCEVLQRSRRERRERCDRRSHRPGPQSLHANRRSRRRVIRRSRRLRAIRHPHAAQTLRNRAKQPSARPSPQPQRDASWRHSTPVEEIARRSGSRHFGNFRTGDEEFEAIWLSRATYSDSTVSQERDGETQCRS
jgi:hypothetical protein